VDDGGAGIVRATDIEELRMERGMRIRPAAPEDIPEMLAFIRELAEYEREPASAFATEADLLRDGFSEPRRFHALIAECSERASDDGKRRADNEEPSTELVPAGLALYFHNYSTWRGHAGIYLEDLFVRPRFRGRGIGKALLAEVAAIAVAEGCPRFEWAVLDWNTPAIDFYRSLGAECLSEWRIMRVSGSALSALASLADAR
jgi:GNAT superfamily N-acetyltransferase